MSICSTMFLTVSKYLYQGFARKRIKGVKYCIDAQPPIILFTDSNEWSVALAEWIRHNDESLLKSTSKVLTIFQEDLVPATSVDEIIDVCGLMQDIPNPQSFLLEILSSVP